MRQMNYKWMSFLCDALLWQEAFKLLVPLWTKAKIFFLLFFFFLAMRSLRMRRERPLGEDPVPSILIHSLFARHPHVLCMSRLHRWITQWAPLSNLERHRITIKSICLYFLHHFLRKTRFADELFDYRKLFTNVVQQVSISLGSPDLWVVGI